MSSLFVFEDASGLFDFGVSLFDFGFAIGYFFESFLVPFKELLSIVLLQETASVHVLRVVRQYGTHFILIKIIFSRQIHYRIYSFQ
jgi:hypothetical protein